jgi:hypothetical protein
MNAAGDRVPVGVGGLGSSAPPLLLSPLRLCCSAALPLQRLAGLQSWRGGCGCCKGTARVGVFCRCCRCSLRSPQAHAQGDGAAAGGDGRAKATSGFAWSCAVSKATRARCERGGCRSTRGPRCSLAACGCVALQPTPATVTCKAEYIRDFVGGRPQSAAVVVAAVAVFFFRPQPAAFLCARGSGCSVGPRTCVPTPGAGAREQTRRRRRRRRCRDEGRVAVVRRRGAEERQRRRADAAQRPRDARAESDARCNAQLPTAGHNCMRAGATLTQ